MLSICDVGSTKIPAPSFSFLEGILSTPQAFSGLSLLDILKTSSLFVNWSLKEESDSIFRAKQYSLTEFIPKIFFAAGSQFTKSTARLL